MKKLIRAVTVAGWVCPGIWTASGISRAVSGGILPVAVPPGTVDGFTALMGVNWVAGVVALVGGVVLFRKTRKKALMVAAVAAGASTVAPFVLAVVQAAQPAFHYFNF